MSGGITHHWLENWLDLAGTKRFGAIWGRRPDGMPAFPSGVSAPRFLTGQRKRGSEFDAADTRQGWYVNWTARCLGIGAQEAALYLPRLLQLLRTRTCSRCGPLATAPLVSTGCGPVMSGSAAGSRGGRGRDARLRHLPLAAGRPPGTARRLDQRAVPPVPVHRDSHRDGRPGVREGLLPSALLREAPDKVVIAEHIGAMTRVQRDGWSGPSATAPGTTTRTSCPAPPPWNSASTSATCPRSSSRRCHAARPATCSARVVRAGVPGTCSWSIFAGRWEREQYFLADPHDLPRADRLLGRDLSAVDILRREYLADLSTDALARFAGCPRPRRASGRFRPDRA